MALDPTYAIAHFNCGNLALAQLNWEMALGCYTKVFFDGDEWMG